MKTLKFLIGILLVAGAISCKTQVASETVNNNAAGKPKEANSEANKSGGDQTAATPTPRDPNAGIPAAELCSKAGAIFKTKIDSYGKSSANEYGCKSEVELTEERSFRFEANGNEKLVYSINLLHGLAKKNSAQKNEQFLKQFHAQIGELLKSQTGQNLPANFSDDLRELKSVDYPLETVSNGKPQAKTLRVNVENLSYSSGTIAAIARVNIDF